ncbi:Mini-ribonuclease 3 [Gallibacter sp. Marseille-QA0791]|uniref:Mini-ribonuclease 3 n=1 Tax=Gallibacter sp. Marseille-QA0791 TaxID=3378781 RepID=UPI003D11E157
MENPKDINTTVLAYMGDAVYEQAVREHIIRKRPYDANWLHRTATAFVKAQAQAEIIKTMFDGLSEEEQRLVKRARNKKFTTKARNADPVTYKWATAFEALVGYLYLAGETERLGQVIEEAIAIVEGGNDEQSG